MCVELSIFFDDEHRLLSGERDAEPGVRVILVLLTGLNTSSLLPLLFSQESVVVSYE